MALLLLIATFGIAISKPIESFVNSEQDGVGIYNGNAASWSQFPFMASLRHAESKEHCCGASIVSLNPPRLLTSAMCVNQSVSDPCTKEVIIGCDSGNCLGSNVVSYEIDTIVSHPDFSINPAPINDIAIIKLKANTIDKPANVTTIDLQQGIIINIYLIVFLSLKIKIYIYNNRSTLL